MNDGFIEQVSALSNDSDMVFDVGGDLYFTLDPGNSIVIPVDVRLALGSLSRRMYGTLSGLVIESDLLTISSELVVDGTARFLEPIITLGESLADSKDRGIAFHYKESLGWFGYDYTNEYFTYFRQATNINSVIAGTLGNAKFDTGFFETLMTSHLSSTTGSIRIPSGIQLQFGDSNHLVSASSSLILSSSGQIQLSSTSVLIPDTVPLFFGNSSTRIFSSDGSLNVVMNDGFIEQVSVLSNDSDMVFDVGGDLYFTLDPGNSIVIPVDVRLALGSLSRRMYGTLSGFVIESDLLTISSELVVDGTARFLEPIITLGESLVDGKDRGIAFHYKESLGWFGSDYTNEYFTYFRQATNIDSVITGTLGDAKFKAIDVESITSAGDLQVELSPGSGVVIPSNVHLSLGSSELYGTGTSLVINAPKIDVQSDLNVNGNLVVEGDFFIRYTTEHLTISSGQAIHPSNVNVSFISVIGQGTAESMLIPGTVDGAVKTICVTSLAENAIYQLNAPQGRLIDPGSGSMGSKKIIFDCPGQSLQLIWNNVAQVYFIANAGCEIIAV